MDDAAILETPDVSVNADISAEEPIESTAEESKVQQDKLDGRKQPDALKKHISDLRRRADSITDPIEKKAELDRIKFLYDTSGKARGYEEVYPTVREAREVKALIDAVGGREGFEQMQTTLSTVAEIDAMLSAGDSKVIDRMWQEAPDGMPKLVPAILDRFQKEKPQEYEQFIAPKSIGYLDKSGFPQAFDRMVQAYEAGDTKAAQVLRDQLIQWVVGNRQQAQQVKQADPEVERLRLENEKLRKGDEAKQVDQAYNTVIDHAGGAIDKVLKPMVGKLGLTSEQYGRLREQVWDHLQTTRNANPTYKLVAPSKQKQGYSTFTEYAKQWTEQNAEDAARTMVKAWYGHQLKNGVQQPVTKSPSVANIQQGKEPSPSEIDYSPRGLQAARKAGFKDVGDMILSGQAPLKSGGIRKWR